MTLKNPKIVDLLDGNERNLTARKNIIAQAQREMTDLVNTRKELLRKLFMDELKKLTIEELEALREGIFVEQQRRAPRGTFGGGGGNFGSLDDDPG